MGELEMDRLRHAVEGLRLSLKDMELRLDASDERWERIEKYLASSKDAELEGDEEMVKYLKGMTARQHVILQLFISGMAYEQMAERLGVSINTIKTQAKSVRTKWGVTNRSDLIYCARKAMAAISDEYYQRLTGGIPKNWGDLYAHRPREEDPHWNTIKPTRGASYEEDEN